MTHQEFHVLRSILKGFLNCVEGLQALYGNTTKVVESIRPPALPSELAAIHDSLFDTLSSSAEAANALTSKVISTRADQHVKLDLREFVETFDECWNFVSSVRPSHSSLQHVVNFILDAAVHDPCEFVLKIETAVAAPLSPLVPSSLRPPSSPLLAPGKDSRPSLLRLSSPCASPQANGTPQVRKHLRIEDRIYFTVPATQETLLLTDYLKVIVNLSLLMTDTISCVIEFLQAFNSQTCQVVLGAGAMRSTVLKNVITKHLAFASQSPLDRNRPRSAVMLVEFDELKRDYQEHQNEIHAKPVTNIGDHLSAHTSGVSTRSSPPAKAGANEYMELLVKETVRSHKLLLRYLARAVVEFVMTQAFAVIDHRLSEEYTKIDLSTLEAKERRALTAEEIQRAIDRPPRDPRRRQPHLCRYPPATLRSARGAPLSLLPTRRGSLFLNERIKGMPSRGTTAPPIPSPPPTQEKPGGFKQVAAPLSPAPLTALLSGASSSPHVPASTSGDRRPAGSRG
ncbi:Vps54-like protein-domain-containing protein [Lactarius vividus]|nr:Vps54-like protein-domain-containing protein [Lactarius vividus]